MTVGFDDERERECRGEGSAVGIVAVAALFHSFCWAGMTLLYS